jgi:hypothetical protein
LLQPVFRQELFQEALPGILKTQPPLEPADDIQMMIQGDKKRGKKPPDDREGNEDFHKGEPRTPDSVISGNPVTPE